MKYYVPKIEEFHNGFEYEVMIPHAKLWSKETFFLNKSHIDLVKYIDIQDEFTKNKIRVKYLDREDIEELGWKFNDVGDYKIDAYYSFIISIPKPNEATIEYRMRTIGDNTTIWSEDTDATYFSGTIKNKSKLKSILNDLGI